MMIANRETQGVMVVTEANRVTPTMVTTDTVQPIFLLLRHHLPTTTAATNLLVAHLDLRVAVMREMPMAEAEALRHPHLPYLPSHNHPKALHLLSNKAILLVMAVAVAETAGSKVMTITVARAVAMVEVEEEMMEMEVDTEEETMTEDAVVGNKEVTVKDRVKGKDARKGREEVRVSLVDMRARGEDSTLPLDDGLCRLSLV